ncbi:MAG: class I SAM-dependent methyltransferase [Thiobacillus sp.]|nr:class I SAM-dependent methyltransferase [Thiobacillus sp.]
MPKDAPFEQHSARYEAWFDAHDETYVSELLALRIFVPLTGRGLEIGVGSGRFAAVLGIQVGLDPSPAMLALARARGIDVVRGIAEDLPFADDSFDHALVVTTLCFVDSPAAMLAGARRVLKPAGPLVIGFIDRNSAIGQAYDTHRAESVFYEDARFYSAGEVERLLVEAGFHVRGWAQTLTRPRADSREIEPAQPGHGAGAFVVVMASNGKPARSGACAQVRGASDD